VSPAHMAQDPAVPRRRPGDPEAGGPGVQVLDPDEHPVGIEFPYTTRVTYCTETGGAARSSTGRVWAWRESAASPLNPSRTESTISRRPVRPGAFGNTDRGIITDLPHGQRSRKIIASVTSRVLEYRKSKSTVSHVSPARCM